MATLLQENFSPPICKGQPLAGPKLKNSFCQAAWPLQLVAESKLVPQACPRQLTAESKLVPQAVPRQLMAESKLVPEAFPRQLLAASKLAGRTHF